MGHCRIRRTLWWVQIDLQGDKGCFPLVLFVNLNVVVPPSDVKFGKQGGVFRVIDEVYN